MTSPGFRGLRAQPSSPPAVIGGGLRGRHLCGCHRGSTKLAERASFERKSPKRDEEIYDVSVRLPVPSWWGLGSGAGRDPAASVTRGKRASSISNLPGVSAGTGRRLGGPGGVSRSRRAQRTSENRPRTRCATRSKPCSQYQTSSRSRFAGPTSQGWCRAATLSRQQLLSAWIDGPNRFSATGVRSTALSIRFGKKCQAFRNPNFG